MELNDNPFSRQALKVYAITIFFYSISSILLMILPFYSISFGASKTAVGLIMGATMFASMFFRPIAGKIIDRFGAKKVVLTALFMFSASLPGYFVPNLVMFGLIRLVQGIVAAFFSTAMQLYTMDLLSEKVRGQAFSLYSLCTMIPSTFGPALALYLKDIMPINSIIIFLVLVGAVNFLFGITISMKSISLKSNQETISLKDEPFSSSKKVVWKNRKLAVSSAIMLLASVSNGAIFTFLPLYLESNHLDYAKLYFLTQTIVLVLCRFLGRKYIPSNGSLSKSSLAALLLLVAVGTWLIASYVALPILIIAAIFNGVAFSMLYPTLLTFISFSVSKPEKGFTIGLFISAADFGYALGAFAMGPLVDVFSYKPMYLICTALCVLAGCLIFLYKKEVKP